MSQPEVLDLLRSSKDSITVVISRQQQANEPQDEVRRKECDWLLWPPPRMHGENGYNYDFEWADFHSSSTCTVYSFLDRSLLTIVVVANLARSIGTRSWKLLFFMCSLQQTC